MCDPSDLFTWCSTVATRCSQGDSVAIERQDHPCAQVLLQRADVSLRAATEGSLKTGVCVRQSIDWMHTEHVSPQFNQFGVELIGSAGWVADIEMITMASHFLDAIGLGGVVEVLDKSFFRVSNSLLHQLKINTLGDRASREAYRNVLVDYLRSVRGELSADSVQR